MRHERHGRFDERLEKKIFSKTLGSSFAPIEISVRSYKGASPKLHLSRVKEETRRRRSSKMIKLGKFTKKELEGLLPIIEEAMHHMK